MVDKPLSCVVSIVLRPRAGLKERRDGRSMPRVTAARRKVCLPAWPAIAFLRSNVRSLGRKALAAQGFSGISDSASYLKAAITSFANSANVSALVVSEKNMVNLLIPLAAFSLIFSIQPGGVPTMPFLSISPKKP